MNTAHVSSALLLSLILAILPSGAADALAKSKKKPSAPAPVPQGQAARASTTTGFTATISPEGRINLVDSTAGRNVIVGDGYPISEATSLKPVITFVPQPDGFDLKLTYTNSSSAPQKLGGVAIGGVRFGQVINHWDFRHDARMDRHDRGNRNYFTGGLPYPGDLYSPVIVIADAGYTLGFSLLYPVLQYKHSITTHTFSGGAGKPQADRSWVVEFNLLDQLPAGATRDYTVACRAARQPDPWIQTLVPYRDYFQSVYGGVRYTRDPRPVLGVAFSFEELCSPSNPRGWAGDSRRPDAGGWDPWVAWIDAEARTDGFNRVMIWAPSGCYKDNRKLNFPFKFVTPLRDTPALAKSLPVLESLPSHGIDVGYWWGNSGLVMPQWDSPRAEKLNPDNPEHVRQAFDELDTAVKLGAKTVGLDAFCQLDAVVGFRWLEKMKAHAPGITFVTELSAPDILHVLGPTYFYSHQVNGPHVLADFILPGHETWCQNSFALLGAAAGRAMNRAEMGAEIQRVADLGYVPVVLGSVPSPRNCRAADSWLKTIPPALRTGAPAAAEPPAPGPRLRATSLQKLGNKPLAPRK